MNSPQQQPLAERSDFAVDVRMYRALEEETPEGEEDSGGLLGDCFLIRLTDSDGKQSSILIDCGLLLGSPNAKERMERIAKDIVEACGGNVEKSVPGALDLLVVTHRHWDHISGFGQAGHILLDPTKLVIRHLWMSWAEGPEGGAQALQARFEASSVKLTAIAVQLTEAGGAHFGAKAATGALNGLEAFMGPVAAAGRPTSGEIMERLKRCAKDTAFLEPGTVRRTPAEEGAPSLRAFVLGPPRDEKFLFKDDPSAGEAKETYLHADWVDTARLLNLVEGCAPDPSRDSPFARPYCSILADKVKGGAPESGFSPADALAFDWLRKRYYDDSNATKSQAEILEQRRIDGDWLGVLAPLAAKLDSHINNTSLALAFELPDGSVMLFPADAQVGNWLSWHEHDYVDENGRTLKAADLLGRTRFYKVGHHGSHNATLNKLGLAMMTRDDLMAMIPTDEALGKAQGRNGWRMPDPVVNAPLRERTADRILRNDGRYLRARAPASDEHAGAENPFFEKLTETRLFLEYRVHEPQEIAP